jgi:ribosomal protein S18 acetylase RimI-like enzyme
VLQSSCDIILVNFNVFAGEQVLNNKQVSIVECSGGFEESARVIREAFLTVAEEFHITKENAPSNGAFIKADALKALSEKGVKQFDVWQGDERVGFFAIEDAGGGIFYIEKLSVLPGKRHGGIGKSILDFCVEYIKSHGGEKISIAIVNENTVLKRWYEEYGFSEVRLKTFEHLPFTVCFMELPLV